MSTKIELAKTRDFGEIISDSFMFVRENIGPLVKCFFIFCGFFILAAIVSSTLQQAKMMGTINNFNPDDYSSVSSPFDVFSRFLSFEFFLAMLFQFLMYITLMITVISYMAIYKAKGNQPATPEEVWGYIKYYFLKIAGSSILIAIMMVIGFVCCVIPGIWLYPIFSLIFPIMIIENTGFGYAFSQSFRIIKDNWWVTFGVLFVMGIIISIMAAIVVMPASLITVGSVLLHPSKGLHLSTPLVILTTSLSALSHIFYILGGVSVTLCYYSLTEQKDSTGLMDRINQMGNDTPDTNLPGEEY